MYEIGDIIVYETSGVCKVAEIGTPSLAHVDKKKLYYTLAPVYSTELIHVPVDTGAFMRPVMTSGEAEALIAQIPDIAEDTVDIQNLQRLLEHYQATFQSHDCMELIQLIKSLYQKDANAAKRGKKMNSVDRRFQKRAEELLHGELSVALGIPKDSVTDYIKRRIAQDIPA